VKLIDRIYRNFIYVSFLSIHLLFNILVAWLKEVALRTRLNDEISVKGLITRGWPEVRESPS